MLWWFNKKNEQYIIAAGKYKHWEHKRWNAHKQNRIETKQKTNWNGKYSLKLSEISSIPVYNGVSTDCI